MKELRDCLRPKTGYGSRAIVVPLNTIFSSSSLGKFRVTGRIAGPNIRMLSSAAGDPSTVESDATKKLRRLSELCAKNPHAIIREPLINLMYNPRLYEIAL